MNEDARLLGNRYQVGELIGRGGMAEVHIGYDTRLGRSVAIKILRPDLARDPSFQTRFRREAQAAAGLNHPAIVAVYDTGEEQVVSAAGERQVVPYIVMEYVEGHTVRDILKEGAAAPIDEAVEIVAGVLTGLEYAHSAGLVHRDIKPANIMLTPTGAVKVMDFGIARAMADVGQTMTQAQSVIGTAQYLSPEQARGENVDARSDLYSTGCVLFELLCGRPPFTGDSPVAVAYQHVREPAPAPSSFAPDVPAALDQVVLRALAKDRAVRYSSAQEFLADLGAVMAGRPVGPLTGQYAVGSAAAGSGATAVLAASSGTTPQATRVMPAVGGPSDPDDEYVEVDERGRRIRNIIILAIAAAAAVLAVLGLLQLAIPQHSPSASGGAVAVPDVVGETQQAALDLLETFGLTGNVIGEASTEVPQGTVIRTDPPAREFVPEGSIIDVHVSTGATEVEVPSVRGLLEEDAKAKILAAGLLVKEVITVDDEPGLTAGRVARTDPPELQKVGANTEITIFVSSGKIKLPDLVGKTKEAAEASLTALGLRVEWEEQQTDEEEPGTVLAQNPTPGLVEQGSGVVLTVAIPVVMVDVPNIIGQPEASAIAAINGANLVAVTPVTREFSLTVPSGRVISCDPGVGTSVPEGTSVTIVVSKGLDPGPPPTP